MAGEDGLSIYADPTWPTRHWQVVFEHRVIAHVQRVKRRLYWVTSAPRHLVLHQEFSLPAAFEWCREHLPDDLPADEKALLARHATDPAPARGSAPEAFTDWFARIFGGGRLT